MTYIDRDLQVYYIVLGILYSTSENCSNKIWFFFTHFSFVLAYFAFFFCNPETAFQFLPILNTTA